MHSDQPSIIEGGGGASVPVPVARGAGLGCALAGFGLLIAAHVLPWLSVTTAPLQQDFPTTTGGRLTLGLDELPLPTEIFNLGWLIVLAAVAVALAVRAPARPVVVAAGFGLVGGQLALLVGLTRTVKRNGLFRGTFPQPNLPVHLEMGLYCAYAALVLLALALLLAGGAPSWPHRQAGRSNEAESGGPADLTVTAAPTTDPAVWSRAPAEPEPTRWPQTDIEVGGRQPER